MSNAVAIGSRALVSCMMTGRPVGEPSIARLLASGKATVNQYMMAAAASLFSADPNLRQLGLATVEKILVREELEGPRPTELLCPDPHEGMWLLARLGVIAAAASQPDLERLGRRMVQVLSWELRLADLVVSPEGDHFALPGVRGPAGAGISRRALSSLWVEIRRRQEDGGHLVHRGTGGRTRRLHWNDDSDALVDGPATWMQKLLDNDPPPWLVFPQADPLPRHLRLPLITYRWGGGALAYLENPGPAERERYVIRGSKAAKRNDGRELPTTWVRAEWGRPARHKITAGQLWETDPPAPPSDAERRVIAWTSSIESD